MRYEVNVTDTAFTTGAEYAENTISNEEARGYSDQAMKEKLFPEGVVALIGGYACPDDSVYKGGRDETGDIKTFLTLCLLVEAESEEAAEVAALNPDFLTRIVDGLLEGAHLDLEGSWECLDCIELAPQGSV